ncbi:MAG: D-alanyl-D-alanine dipeptidase, partial [Deltaproteobacteria bacterium]|nr:D-alanyl-D-alanine dipeptidase [Deltaproteobacteria bacterium]
SRPSPPPPPPVARAPEPAPSTWPIPATAKQLITARIVNWASTRATLQRYRRAGHAWMPEGAPWPAVIGRTGAAWGAGLHGVGAPGDLEGPVKREGDGKSPAGAFALHGAYGYAAQPPAGTRVPYTALDEGWQCIEDTRSAHYNQILDRRRIAIDWTSTDRMRRRDDLFTWIVDVAHNPARTPGAGSCIFLHVWQGETKTTHGCTAMEEPRLAALIAGLDPTAVYVLLPDAEYAALAQAWQLP